MRLEQKKTISLLLVLIMVFGLLPSMAFADRDDSSQDKRELLKEKLISDEAMWGSEKNWGETDWIDSAETTGLGKANSMLISAASRNGVAGMPVKVKIRLTNNPGVSSVGITVSYDSFLQLTSIEYNNAFGGIFESSQNLSSPVRIIWAKEMENYSEDAVFVTLNFELDESAQIGEKANVRVYCNKADIFNANEDLVSYSLQNGVVTVIPAVAGDVNGDGRVTNGDITRLFQIRAQWDVDYNDGAVDVNGDGRVTNGDITRLFQYRANWPVPVYFNGVAYQACDHEGMEHFPALNPSCGEQGNIEYWHCSKCGKYFMESAGVTEIDYEDVFFVVEHQLEHITRVEPTTTTPGNIEYWHCTVCGKYFSDAEAATEISYSDTVIYLGQHTITFNLASYNNNLGDSYIRSEIIDNSVNQGHEHFYPSESFELGTPVCAGYTFLGWYTSDGTRITWVRNCDEDLVLYARWSAQRNEITYRLYRTPVNTIIDESNNHYFVNKGLFNLPTPEINNYIFLGWYTDDGKEVTEIPIGTSGDITLNAYWTSKRYLHKTVSELGNPIICEDSDKGVIYFAYEIGTIENVPLTDDPFWTIQTVRDLALQVSVTETRTISETYMKSLTDTIAKTTVDSSTWTLSEDWNNAVHINQDWATQNGMNVNEAEQKAKTDSNTYSITDANGGSHYLTTTDGTTTVEYDSQNYTHGNSAEFDAKIEGSYTNHKSLSKAAFGEFEISASLEAGYKQHQDWNEHSGTDTTTVDTTVENSTSTWNHQTTSSNTVTASESRTVSKALSTLIAETYGYGKDYALGGGSNQTQGTSTTENSSSNSSSSFTYSTQSVTTTTETYYSDGKSDGWYRLILAGKIHVFGVVGYDIVSKSYFTYTYGVLDDQTYEFLDYSPNSSFSDYENGVIPFEIPFFVYEYTNERTLYTEGLSFATNTASRTCVVDGYSGDSTDILIPSYFTTGGIAYKVVGITSDAFSEKEIRSISLSPYIDEIPAEAFKGQTALQEVYGAFTKIGAEAFSGCSSLNNFTVSANVTVIGENAFAGVEKVTIKVFDRDTAKSAAAAVLPSNATQEQINEKAIELTQAIAPSVIHAGLNSGAQIVVLDISKTIPVENITLEIPAIERFELAGGLQTFVNMKIVSHADQTILREVFIENNLGIPMDIFSPTLTLDAVTAISPGYSLLLHSQSTDLTFIRDNHLYSDSGRAVVCGNVNAVSQGNSSGFVTVSGNVYHCGTINGQNKIQVSNGNFVPISEEEYANYLKGTFKIVFDPDGGQCSEESRTVSNGIPIGILPVPTKSWHTFQGWYLANGTQVNDNDVLTCESDITLYAHWTPNTFTLTFDANGGSCSPGSKTLHYGEKVGDMPTPTRDYFQFNGWFLSNGTQVNSETVFPDDSNQTVYAHWSPNAYTASWSGGNYYLIIVSRTSSPYAGAATGQISSGATVFYGDVLSVTYTPATGYSISNHGSTSISVAGNVTSNDIYASATANNYTYNINYVSTGGTNLGTSTATYQFGTTNTITPPAFSGYNTPGAQTVAWDSTSAKTITFTYSPVGVGTQTVYDNWWWKGSGNSGIWSTATVSFSNRTATSVTATIVWTNKCVSSAYYGVWQKFIMYIGNTNTGWQQIATSSTFYEGNAYNGKTASVTATVTITGLSGAQQTVNYSASTDAQNNFTHPADFSGTLTIPTF